VSTVRTPFVPIASSCVPFFVVDDTSCVFLARVGFNTRLWPDVAQLELIMEVSPAVNEVNLGFHHVRAR